jgi:hypothetical protein
MRPAVLQLEHTFCRAIKHAQFTDINAHATIGYIIYQARYCCSHASMQSDRGVPVDEFGQGEAKTIEQLWAEIQAGETRIQEEDELGTRTVIRHVQVVTVLIRDAHGQVTC